MKLTIEPTNQFVQIDGVRARVWKGKADTGHDVTVHVVELLVSSNNNFEPFETTLKEIAPTSNVIPFKE
jgi:hypothetical protein